MMRKVLRWNLGQHWRNVKTIVNIFSLRGMSSQCSNLSPDPANPVSRRGECHPPYCALLYVLVRKGKFVRRSERHKPLLVKDRNRPWWKKSGAPCTIALSDSSHFRLLYDKKKTGFMKRPRKKCICYPGYLADYSAWKRDIRFAHLHGLLCFISSFACFCCAYSSQDACISRATLSFPPMAVSKEITDCCLTGCCAILVCALRKRVFLVFFFFLPKYDKYSPPLN